MRQRSARQNLRGGFTLLEILLVVAAIAILAGIVIFAVNPGEILAKMRNGERRADLNLLINAVYQYTIDTRGEVPADIITEENIACLDHDSIEVCRTGSDYADCSVALLELTDDQKYLVAVPEDPQGYALGTDGSGYFLMRNEFGRFVACAPNAELGETIEVIR